MKFRIQLKEKDIKSKRPYPFYVDEIGNITNPVTKKNDGELLGFAFDTNGGEVNLEFNGFKKSVEDAADMYPIVINKGDIYTMTSKVENTRVEEND